MATDLLFLRDAYVREFDATVTEARLTGRRCLRPAEPVNIEFL